jgi:hypothetical protein
MTSEHPQFDVAKQRTADANQVLIGHNEMHFGRPAPRRNRVQNVTAVLYGAEQMR